MGAAWQFVSIIQVADADTVDSSQEQGEKAALFIGVIAGWKPVH